MAEQSFVILPGSQRNPGRSARLLGPTDPNQQVEVTIKLRRKAPLPAVSGRPAHPISRSDLGAQFGASADDIDKVKVAMERLGLKVVAADAASRSVRVAGTVRAMEEAFRVKLMNYEGPRGVYRGRVGPVQIPSNLNGVIVGVFGLDNRPVAKPRPHSATELERTPQEKARRGAQAASSGRAWFYPAELATIYQFPDGDGSGQSIGILEFGGGYFPSDLKAFCKAAGVSVPNVIPISVDGAATDARDGTEGEVMLDIEVVAGACPQATIPVYFSNFSEQGWIDNLSTAIHDTTHAPSVLSISWGLAEDDPDWSQGALEMINEMLQAAALAGITVLVASGDDGSSDAETDGRAHVDFPAASPYVLSVGGTTLHVKSGTPAEVAWKDGDGLRADNGGSSGGGVSVQFPRPSWQTVSIPSVNPDAIDGRVVPDVSADASPTTGYFVVIDGNSGVAGGTSAATPLWAALIGRINAMLGNNKHVGYLTPILYKTTPGDGSTVGAASCTDITSGDNITASDGGYEAQPGYDAVTGWGTPLGTKLMAALKQML
jgi:kumamolisin